MRYYEVKAKCGHVGLNYYIPINFGVCAENGKEAAQMTREIPRVKHDHPDAILGVFKISQAEYDRLNEINRNDAFLQCKNIQEQRAIPNLEERMVREERQKEKSTSKRDSLPYRMKRLAYTINEYDEMVFRSHWYTWSMEECS